MPEQSNDYRVVVFGAAGVGKSSLVLRFVKGEKNILLHLLEISSLSINVEILVPVSYITQSVYVRGVRYMLEYWLSYCIIACKIVVYFSRMRWEKRCKLNLDRIAWIFDLWH